MLNHITIMGRFTRDPELRYTKAQKPVTSFSLACERDFAPDGQDKETDFIECVAWRSAEFISKYFQKGSLAVVSGRLQLRDWNDKDGNKRRTAEINVENIYFAGAKKETRPVDESPEPDYEELPDDEEELPF